MADEVVVNDVQNTIQVSDAVDGLSVIVSEDAAYITSDPDILEVSIAGDGIAVETKEDSLTVSDAIDIIKPTFEGGLVQNITYNYDNGVITGIAGADINAFTVLSSFNGEFRVADKDTLEDLNAVIGMTDNTALTGSEVTIITVGQITNPAWSFDVNKPVFVGNNGGITQVPPTTGFSQVIGIPVSTTTMYIQKQVPVAL